MAAAVVVVVQTGIPLLLQRGLGFFGGEGAGSTWSRGPLVVGALTRLQGSLENTAGSARVLAAVRDDGEEGGGGGLCRFLKGKSLRKPR